MSDLGVFILLTFTFLLLIYLCSMECEREEESGEMFSPNESEEYTLHIDAQSFTVQGLRDALTEAESTMTGPLHPTDEFIIQLEVMMAD